MNWRKSSHSSNGGNCVEFAPASSDYIAVRNSRFPFGATLLFDRGAIGAFLQGAKDGEFDDLGLPA